MLVYIPLTKGQIDCEIGFHEGLSKLFKSGGESQLEWTLYEPNDGYGDNPYRDDDEKSDYWTVYEQDCSK